MKKGLVFTMSTVLLALLVAFSVILMNQQKTEYVTSLATRTVELANENIDYESILNEFENATLETTGSLTTFEGYKNISLDDLSELDNLSETDIQAIEEIQVKYNFSYDSETNLVTLSAESVNAEGKIEVDEITGVAFETESGEMDAVLEVEGEYILLSEMQDLGMIENCGWLKKALKKLAVKVTVAVVAVVAVAAVAAVVVATAGLGLGACIAAGAIAGAVAGGIAGGIISYSEYGKLDWKWVVGGIIVGGAIGAVTGWGVGSMAMTTQTAQTNRLLRTAQNGKLDFSNSIKNKSYFQKGTKEYREYYEQANLISQEIMKAKSPVVESGTKYLKWTVEGVQQTAKGTTYGRWELVIDPVKEVIVHFLFAS